MEGNKTKEDEIDLIDLILKVWRERRVVVKSIIIAGIIGLFIAIFSPVKYRVTTIMVPTVADKGVKGSLGGLAAMAGIDLSSGASDVLSPALYPKIIESIPFKREMIETKVSIEGIERPVSYKEFYQDIYFPGIFHYIKEYTIGLPKVVLKAIKEEKNSQEQVSGGLSSLIFISEEEEDVFKILEDNLSLDVNDKEGYIELSVDMPEALAAAQLAKKAQLLLQKYIIDLKSKKAKGQLLFIQECFKEKEKEFLKAEYALANFHDCNKNVISAKAKTIERQLQTQYNLIYSVYSGLAKQMEQQKIQVEEDTPVFSIIEPVSVPVKSSKPKRTLILIAFLFLGGVVGIGIVLGKDFLQELKDR